MSKRPIHQYSESQLEAAVKAIREGVGIRTASRKYGIPRSTLQDRKYGRVPEGPRRMGPAPELSTDEEKALVEWCTNLVKCGFPLKMNDLLNTVQNIVTEEGRVTRFKDGRPGLKWYKGFLKRNPTITHRTPEEISKGRAVVTEVNIKKWFSELKEHLQHIGAEDILEDPTRIYNGDETSFILCPKTGKVIAPRGYKNIYQIQRGKDKEAITVLLFFSASGDILYPCVVFPYIRIPNNIGNSVPSDWIIGKSDSGWMKSEIFLDYVEKGLNKWLTDKSIKKPVLVFVDGHKSHLTMSLSKFCAENEIILYSLPPNTTHMMQPADVSVFKPLKADWKVTVRNWQMQPENANCLLTKSMFCPLLSIILSNKNLRGSVINGFRRCGLYPFNANAVDYTKCVQDNMQALNDMEVRCSQKLPTLDHLEITENVIQIMGDQLVRVGIDVPILLQEIANLKAITKNDDQHQSPSLLPVINDSNIFDEFDEFSCPTINNMTIESLHVNNNADLVPENTTNSKLDIDARKETLEHTNQTSNFNILNEFDDLSSINNMTVESFHVDDNGELVHENSTNSKFYINTQKETLEHINQTSNSENKIRILSDISIKTLTPQKYKKHVVLEPNPQHFTNNTLVQQTLEIDDNKAKILPSSRWQLNFSENNKENVVQGINPNVSSKLLKNVRIPTPPSSRCSSPLTYKPLINISPSTSSRGSPSPIMLKHLKIPSPILKPKRSNLSLNRIGAISSEEWREFERKKEESKQNKINAILQRKQERLRARKEKEEAVAKRKSTLVTRRNVKKRSLPVEMSSTVNKIKCCKCEDDLISDTEDNDLKNIGCDKCPSWFHLKCSVFVGRIYEEIVHENFICEMCK